MIQTRSSLQENLKHYDSHNKEEQFFIDQFNELLQHPASYQRDHFPGHITGSAWIVDETKEFTLLIHHVKLNKWLQPGGHTDGDENIYNVALREAQEETGLVNFRLLRENIFDLDIHLIPARKDFPEHYHYDIRFIFEASIHEKLIISEESNDLAWKRIDDVPFLTDHNTSMMRMVEKTKRLFRTNQQ
jgi:8-oxo-dGTP pyrophosphatase MutT (NUDIX family)